MASQMSEVRASALLYPSLVRRRTPKGEQFECWLAKSMRWGAKGIQEWIFTLRDDVEWVDAKGMPAGRLCVDDIVSTVRAINDPRTHPKPSFAHRIGRAEAGPGKHEVTIFLRYAQKVGNPYSAFLFPILPAASRLEYITRDTPEFRSPRYFLGPYVLTPSKAPEDLVFVANRRYFEGEPGIQKIAVRVNEDVSVLSELLLSRLVHALPELQPATRYEVVWRGYHLTLAAADPYSFDFLGFNLDAKVRVAGRRLGNPFSRASAALRRAVAASLDIEGIARRAYQDYAQRKSTPFCFHPSGLVPAAPVKEAPDADAVTALHEFVQADDRPTSISLAYKRDGGSSDAWRLVSRALKEELEGLLRIPVDLVPLDERGWQYELHQKPRDERRFHLALDRFSLGPEPDISPLLASTGRLNFMHYDNGYVDGMLALVRGGDSKTSADAYGRIQQAISRDPPVVVCWHVKGYMAYNHELFDCTLDPFQFFFRAHTWRARGR